ncbi:M6 family metalloprotease domain-containing protein, partial [Enterococcus ureilyticus]|uniref:M6 family metalloprotease domain-containing protein n=1 Tax=Enterococcus ureilyticus TaxID=1131292 RepID=UPI001A91D17C
MKKKLFSCLVFCSMIVGTQMVDASPANPEVFSFKQPSGETFKAQTKGDERFNYVVTEGGIGLEQGDDGFWYYLQQGNTRNAQIPTTLSKSKVGIDTQPSNAADEQTLLQSKRNERELEIEQKEPAIKVKSSKKKDQNLLVLLVEFEDVKLKYSDEDWSRLIFGETAPSLKNYYSMTTNNGIGIDPARETNGSPNDGIIRLTLDGKHPNTGQQLITENQKITRSALEKADQFIDYKQYDTNGNGRIETDELHFMVIVAGQEQSYGNVTEPAVWGHRWALNSLRVTLDDTVLDYYTQFGEKHAARQATLGIIAHEFGHDIGLPDLYNVGFKDENGVTEKQGSGLGYTSVMASGSWGARPGEESGTTPVGLDAYSKSLLGMAVETITTSQSGKLVQSIDEGTPAILKVNSAEEKEYFLIENRQLSGYDEGMKRGNAIHSGGIAIYRINKNYTQNQTAGKQLVTVLEADESTRGYSYYESGGVWNADPFYYVGNNIHNKEQAIKLSKDTNPSSKIADGFGEFDLTIESKSNRNMTVSFSEPIVPVESISIDSENIEINVRDTKQLMAKIVPENASDKEIKWTSTDDSIVSINQEGKLVGKSSGTVTISAINEKFNVKKEIQVTVKSKLGKTAGEAVEYTFEELTSHNLVESKQFQESGWLKLKVPETGYYDVGGSWGFTAVPGYEGKGRIKAEFFQEHSLEQSAGNTNLVNIENSGTGSASVTNKGLPIYYEKDSYMYVKFNLKELSGDCPYIFILKKSKKEGGPILTADENLSLSSEVGAIPNVSTYYKLNKKYKLNITNKIVPTLAPQYKLETSTPNVVTLTKENDVYYMEFKTYGTFKLTLIEQVSGATKDFTDEVRERTNSPLGKTAGEAVEYTFEELTFHNLVESKQFQESGWLKLKVPETGYYDVGGSWGFTAVPGYEGKGRIKAEFFQEHSLEQSAGNTNLVNIENSGTGSASVTNKGLPIYYEKDSYM